MWPAHCPRPSFQVRETSPYRMDIRRSSSTRSFLQSRETSTHPPLRNHFVTIFTSFLLSRVTHVSLQFSLGAYNFLFVCHIFQRAAGATRFRFRPLGFSLTPRPLNLSNFLYIRVFFRQFFCCPDRTRFFTKKCGWHT